MFSTASVIGVAALVLSGVWLFIFLPRLGRAQERFEAELEAAHAAADSGDRRAAESHAVRAEEMTAKLGARSADARAAVQELRERMATLK